MSKTSKSAAAEAQELERSYKLADIVKQRQHTLTTLALQPGEKVFDIGCGVGFLTLEMAQQVGKSGQVIGFDQNPEMISNAKKRCEGLQQAEFHQGDAIQLPAQDQTFDAVSCTQVLLYVKDVPKVLAEMRRILKPGGRMVIVETDWRGVVLNSGDDALTKQIFAAWDSAVPSPNLPVHLGPLLKKHGFSNIQVEAVPIINTEYSPNHFSCEMMKWITKNAVKQGVFNETQRKEFLADLEERERSGSYFFCVNRFLFSAKL
ncbi:MAG: methyltransferase domain-containing protein [SAR324 cluster bacterium]|nr:methyltransferase domain-containing protein [SAR324 cluster bacterium]MBL7035867.1 methyltransferase domain-containing protein [SAR324 cluster bacterium]